MRILYAQYENNGNLDLHIINKLETRKKEKLTFKK